MSYINPDDSQRTYQSLDDLIVDLVAHPNELFMHDHDCEALVYVSEVDMIFLITDKSFHGSDDQRKEVLSRKYQEIRKFVNP